MNEAQSMVNNSAAKKAENKATKNSIYTPACALLLTTIMSITPNVTFSQSIDQKKLTQDTNKARILQNIQVASQRWNLDATLICALIEQESRFNPKARSRTGAAGLGQFTRIGCAEVRRLTKIRRYAKVLSTCPDILRALRGFDKRSALDGDLAVEAVAIFMAHLMRLYKNDVAAALTHYNAGRRAALAVAKHGHTGALERGLLKASQARHYAPQVMQKWAKYQN